jgi:hypothetical protein
MRYRTVPVPLFICLYFQTNRREEAGGQSSKIVLKASELFDHKVYLHEVKLHFLSAFRIRIDLEELDVLCLGPKASSVA